MGRRLRLWQPGKIYNVTSRCVDRQFLLKPNHMLGNPLLREDSDPDSLEPWNNLVPKPSMINIVGASIGRALEKYPVPLYFAEAQINHLHSSIGLNSPAQASNSKLVTSYDASMFLQCTNSLIARFVNKQCDREGPVFSATARTEAIIDDAAAEEKLFYALTNPVKDGMVETVKQSPFFNTYRHLAYGDPLRYWFIDWHAWWLAGGFKNRRHEAKNYLKWTQFELTPLPAWQDLTVTQRQTRVRVKVRELEEYYAELRKHKNRTVIGVRALFQVDPRDRPQSPKKSGKQSLCHASDPRLRHQFKKDWREFVHEHRKASIDYRKGYYDREFPEGSFRPVIKKIYSALL